MHDGTLEPAPAPAPGRAGGAAPRRPTAEREAAPGHVEITTRTARLWRRDDGILYVLNLPDREQGLAEARQNSAAFARLSGGRRRPALVDLRPLTRGISHEARAFYAGEERAASVSAIALLVGSPLSRVVGNFFVGLNRPKVPTRLFTDEGAAVAWLREYDW